MNTAKPAYTEIPDRSILTTVKLGGTPSSGVISLTMPFDQVKHLLSSKPLRRPNRTRLQK